MCVSTASLIDHESFANQAEEAQPYFPNPELGCAGVAGVAGVADVAECPEGGLQMGSSW